MGMNNHIILEIFYIPYKTGDNFIVYSKNKREYGKNSEVYPCLTEYINGLHGAYSCWLSSYEKAKDLAIKISSKKPTNSETYSVFTNLNVVKITQIHSLIEKAIVRRKAELLGNKTSPYKMTPSDKRTSKKFLLEKIRKGIISPFDVENYIDQKFYTC